MREIKPKSPEHLKDVMEMQGGVMICQVCDAHMWVEHDIEGNATLMRIADVHHELCPICDQIHKIASQ